MVNGESRLPEARAAGLLKRDLPDGIIVYDTERHQAHSLNRTAALVWQRCDGRTRMVEMAAQLRQLDLPADETVIWLALERLEKAHLLRERLPRHWDTAGISRRGVIRRLGLVGRLAALLPLVESLTAPSTALAQSGGGTTGTTTGATSGTTTGGTNGTTSGGTTGTTTGTTGTTTGETTGGTVCIPLGSPCTVGGTPCCGTGICSGNAITGGPTCKC